MNQLQDLARENDLLAQDRNAAMALLALHIIGHRYVKGCKSNGGIACYSCRTVEWLEAHSGYRHVSPPDDGSMHIELRAPSPDAGTAAVPTTQGPCCEAANRVENAAGGARYWTCRIHAGVRWATAEQTAAGPAPEPHMCVGRRCDAAGCRVARPAPQRETEPRVPGCQCHLEVGDSPCRVHGEEEDCDSCAALARAAASNIFPSTLCTACGARTPAAGTAERVKPPATCQHPAWSDNGICHACGQQTGRSNWMGPVRPGRHLLEELKPKPRTTVKKFAAELKARTSKVEAAFNKPDQEQFVAGANYVQGVVDALLSDYDVRDPEDYPGARTPAAGTAPKGEK